MFSNDTSKPKIYKNPSQVETVNEIKKLHDETENETIDTDSSNVDLSSEDFLLCKNSPKNHANAYR